MQIDNKSCDVIVIGAGMAGHCAALEAARSGASVLLLEKMPEYGGSTMMCGGAFAFAGTRVQKEQGIADTPELLEKDLITCSHNAGDPAIMHAYAEHQYDAYRWLEDLGLVFDNVTLNGGQSVPRLHSLDPKAMLRLLHKALVDAGGAFRSNAGVKRLLTSGEGTQRRVTGVELVNGECIGAEGGVSIAPHLVHTMYKGGMIVNLNSERFINESESYKVIGEECLKQPRAVGVQIFDQAIMGQSAPFPTVDDYNAALEAGLIKRADTLAGLAAALGLPADHLQATVDRYNAACEGRGPDDMGRDCLTAGYGKPHAFTTGPYYGIACTTGLNSTYCGLHTDARARVLDVFGAVIPGLYATGEVMGGLHGASYLSGSSLAKGCIFGRLAAQDALRHARKEAVVA